MKHISLVILLGLLVGCGYFRPDPTKGPDTASQPEPKLSVEVAGVDNEIVDNIKAHVTLSRKRCDIPPAYLKSLLKSAREETANALAAFGYYEPKVDIATDSAGPCPVIKINVSALGRETLLSDVDINVVGEAADDSVFMKSVDSIDLLPGSRLKHSVYEKAKQTLSSLAAERGYFDAKFVESRLEVEPDQARARALLTFDSGRRYRVGQVSIYQEPDLVSEDLVRRYFPNDTAVPYTAETINGINNALLQSNYFRSVDARPEINARTHELVPVSVDLVPRARHSFSASAGLSTDEGIRGRLKYLNRRLNRAGHRGVLDGRASFIAQSGSMEYLIPRDDPRAEWLTFQAGVRRENVDSFDTVETQGSISETKLRPFGWLETRYIRITNQDFDIASQNETSLFVIPGLHWARTTADDELYPTKGAKYSFEIRGAAESLLSDTSFVRATLAAHWIRGLPIGSRVHLRTSFGGTWVDDFFELPPSERFFTGGDTTIRGYEFEELGPEDDAGEVIGGTYLGIVSFEYEHPVTDTWSGAAFVDAGNAFGGEGSSTGVKLGIGIGVRWRSPVGPIRADLAHPVDGNQTVRFHLRIGPDL